jgi:hypothetical protein
VILSEMLMVMMLELPLVLQLVPLMAKPLVSPTARMLVVSLVGKKSVPLLALPMLASPMLALP